MAYAEAGNIRGSVTLRMPRVHAEKLAPSIEFLLQSVDTPPSSLEAIAISAGPGSYTGLRIGVSTAKGIAYAHNLPMVAVSTLEGLAVQVQPFAHSGHRILAALDARRGDLYAALFEVVEPSLEIPLQRHMEDAALPAEELVKKLPSDGSLWLVGDGIPQLLQGLPRIPEHWHPLPWSVVHPSAPALIPLAMRAIRDKAFVDLASFEPTYIRAFKTHPPRPRHSNPHPVADKP